MDHKGFSLLEMSCVLIVMSILASAAIPALTQSFFEKAGEKVSLDISAIEEGARAYFVANGSWPASINVLEAGSFLPATWNALNPFGNAYTTSVNGSVFSVSTQVINGTQTAITNRLPVSSANGLVVTSSIPPPGASSTGFGPWQAINFNTAYQAPTDGIIEGSVYFQAGISGVQQSSANYYSSSSLQNLLSSPTVSIPLYFFVAAGSTTREWQAFSFHVRKGDWYEMLLTGGPEQGGPLFFLPSGI